MDDKHLEKLAIWIADNLSPIERQDMPQIFDGEEQEKLWEKVCEILRYKD